MTASAATTGPPSPPSGWFALGFADRVPRGRVEACRLNGRELVLFRTDSGRLALLDAHCPHLGAHLGHGGSVHGETLRCPFHGFRFGPGGGCVATEYGCPPPPTARLRSWPVREVGGVILAWTDAAGREPWWEVPPLDTSGWTPWYTRRLEFAGYPQETTENSVDIGHLSVLHGFDAVRQTPPLTTDGPHLRAAYTIRRPRRRLGFAFPAVDAGYTADVWGLGWSRVDVDVPDLGLHLRALVLATPTDPGRLRLHLGISVPLEHPSTPVGSRTGRMLRRLPAGLLARAIGPLGIAELARDVAQDIGIWEHKVYRARPALAAKDGPIGPYRRWARQFDPVSADGPPEAVASRSLAVEGAAAARDA